MAPKSQVSICDTAFRLKLAKKHSKFITPMTLACLVRFVHEKYLLGLGKDHTFGSYLGSTSVTQCTCITCAHLFMFTFDSWPQTGCPNDSDLYHSFCYCTRGAHQKVMQNRTHQKHKVAENSLYVRVYLVVSCYVVLSFVKL